MRRSGWLVAFGAVVVIIGCGVEMRWEVVAQARLSAATPRLVGVNGQNGWSIIAASKGNVGAAESPSSFRRFIRTLLFGKSPYARILDRDNSAYPNLVIQTPPEVIVTGQDEGGGALTFEGRTPKRELFPLEFITPSSPEDGLRHMACVPIPAVPTEWPWIDVLALQKGKVQAVWRITNLPHLVHNQPANRAMGPISLGPGVTVGGFAYWEPSWSPDYGSASPRCPLMVNLYYSDSHEKSGCRRIEDARLTQEWDAAPQAVVRSGSKNEIETRTYNGYWDG